MMRKSTIYLLVTALNASLFVLMLLHARYGRIADRNGLMASAAIARELRLTDLCLFTEARYTRNPAMADLFSAFQDHPLALEHFPSGSLVSPPSFLARRHEQSP